MPQPLQDLFRRHRERATGLWKLEGEGGRTLFLDSGDIVFAISGRPQDRITALLVEKSRLTQVQLDYAMANLKPGLSVGRNLIDMGYITQRDLLEVAKLQVERVVSGVMSALGESASFESRELDATTVRLPLDTPQMLLNGLLELKDREALLELLGPLNQVVVLEGRKHLSLDLPQDLAKVPPCFDGTRTLLEVGREVPVEPLRVGALALFLREMGWARLHELPSLDRQALDAALSPDELDLSLPLPGTPGERELPSLFAAIKDAERPTTNLEHLSGALDDLLPLEDAPHPFIESVKLPESLQLHDSSEEDTDPEIEEAFVSMPTPALELPEFVPSQVDDEDPPLKLSEQVMGFEDDPVVSSSANVEVGSGIREPRSRTWVWGLILVALVGTGLWWFLGRQAVSPVTEAISEPESAVASTQASPGQSPSPSMASPKADIPEASGERNEALTSETRESVSPVKEAPPESLSNDRDHARRSLDAIRRGDLPVALKAGEAIAGAASGEWCIRLELATQVDTIKAAPGYFKEPAPLFLLPFRLRDGRTSYQVLLGPFKNQEELDRRLASLPDAFRAGGNKPLRFQVGKLPRRQ